MEVRRSQWNIINKDSGRGSFTGVGHPDVRDAADTQAPYPINWRDIDGSFGEIGKASQGTRGNIGLRQHFNAGGRGGERTLDPLTDYQDVGSGLRRDQSRPNP
jgi:hypothetical protein